MRAERPCLRCNTHAGGARQLWTANTPHVCAAVPKTHKLQVHLCDAAVPISGSLCGAAVPKTHRREVQAIFPDLDGIERVTIVPTCQHAALSLLNTGERVDTEKDALLETFCAWAAAVCDRLAAAGHWCDYIDPCSGLPVRFSTALGGLLRHATAPCHCGTAVATKTRSQLARYLNWLGISTGSVSQLARYLDSHSELGGCQQNSGTDPQVPCLSCNTHPQMAPP